MRRESAVTGETPPQLTTEERRGGGGWVTIYPSLIIEAR